ncbi:AAA family ATPase [Actinomadura barringtoniae]|uniref:AAA family ATPase n=1 Tax=Actinomadura barringtoniae TaxID=1427535 RepID=A0A939P9M7_9ACTN|nr:AAA family ATPase [Actinomadura barringtoniae]MBO2448490.1 AAA family ATPase [Actinomadura barringtoniae]
MGIRQVEDVKSPEAALREEQEYVTRVYTRLDAERDEAERTVREGPGGTGGGGAFQARLERAVATDEAARRLDRLTGVERGLCFGRIDHRRDDTAPEGEDADEAGPRDTFYIGRIGLRDEHREPLLIDWRAEAARPFYTATPTSPGTLARRRHLHLRLRELVRIDDEVFDLDGLSTADQSTIVGEAALLATLRRGRTGRMSDVVATIQEEQDQVIRAGLPGVLVVQGGPGTGKTVAALHRAAYLLYTHREVLERRGVLVVGPNATFMRYIEQVLPGLGESDVALATVGELFPGVRATAAETPEVAILKGGLRMAGMIESAVRDRQRAPQEGLEIENDGMVLRVEPARLREIRDRARNLRASHNVQRRLFVHDVLQALAVDRAEQYDKMTDEPLQEILRSGNVPQWLQELLDEAEDQPLLDGTDLKLAKEALWAEPAVRQLIDDLWPELTPQQLLSELFADAAALERVGGAAALTKAERADLFRPADAEWTVSDVPLLDEAAELLGAPDDAAERARLRAAQREVEAEEQYAREVIESTGVEQIGIPEIDLLNAGELAERHVEDALELAERQHYDGLRLTTAQRAAADREWAYGHVIVDEAQELSEMAWRAVMRKVPTRSLTVVGDVAQTGNPAGARSWGDMLDRYVHGRWREQRLMVNYRTPAAIMRIAADVLAEVAPEQTPPEPVRDDGPPPGVVRMDAEGIPGGLPALVDAELIQITTDRIGEGRLAVIASAATHPAVRAALPDAEAGATPEALDSPVVVLTPEESKGLEFDSVIVVDPAGIIDESPRGGHDLYVAITRATRRMTLVQDGDLPPMLSGVKAQEEIQGEPGAAGVQSQSGSADPEPSADAAR